MTEVQHSIKIASQRCGLSPHVIRVWEKRYDAVSPDRTDTNRRRYSDAEVERLTLLRMATEAGHTISSVARVPTEKLRELVADALPAVPIPKSDRTVGQVAEINMALAAIRDLNAADLEAALARAALRYGQHGLLEHVVAPLALKVGELWRGGELTAADEHFASAAIRGFLIRNSKPYALDGGTPTIVIGTPAGQLHELGAVIIAAAANDMGWRVTYLGSSLPAMEIAGAAIRNQACVVALSIVFPGDDPNLPRDLENLRKLLPAEVKLLLGGRAAESYQSVITSLGITLVKTVTEFYEVLERLRVSVT